MYPVSAAFKAAMVKSNVRLIKLEQLNGAMTVIATFQTVAVSGRVQMQQSKEARRNLTLEIANPGGIYTPSLTTDPFFFNQRVRVWLGTILADGVTAEYAPVGTFLVNIAEASSKTQTLAVTALDFWKYLQIASLLTMASYAAGATLLSIFTDLINQAQSALNGITITRDIDPTAATTTYTGTVPLQFAAGSRIADCLAVFFDAYGWDFWFDPLGTFVARPYVQPETIAPSFTWADTDAGVVDFKLRLEDSPDVRNHVRVNGTSPDIAPMTAEAKDNNQNSPTYVGGIFGDRLDVFDSPDLLSLAQAQNVANQRLRRQVMFARSITIESTPRPELDAFDVGTMTSLPAKISAANYWVESMTLPLTVGSASTKLVEVKPLS